MERKDFVMLPFASWHIRDFALLANTLIKILARGVGQNEVARTLVKCRLVCWCVIVKLSLEAGCLLESLITACGIVKKDLKSMFLRTSGLFVCVKIYCFR